MQKPPMPHPEFPTPPDPYAPVAPPPPPKPRRSGLLRFIVWGLVDLLAVAAVLAGAFWWWTGSDQSLATGLAQVQRFLPADQTLATRDVSGSLRHGGHIGGLRWSSPTLTVDLEGLDIDWRLRPLLNRDLKLGEVHVRSVVIEPLGPPSTTPTQPLNDITLPIRVDVPFRIDDLRWVGPPPLQATALAGHYQFDGTHHLLTVDGVDIADGHYGATVRLQGAAPMALDATLDGRITTPVPGSSIAPLAVVAHAKVQGTLAGQEARLQVQAELEPHPGTGVPGQQAMRAQLQAEIAPWEPQPLLQAQAQFNALNLAQLWPQAPVTRLDGTITAGAPPTTAATAPSASTESTASTLWRIDANVRNGLPGPWDKNRLPMDQLAAQALFDGTSWTVPRATVRAGPGEVTLQGSWSPAPAPWQINATVRNLSPAVLHTQLAPAALSGTAKASQAGDTVTFDVAINSAAKATAPPRTIRIDNVIAQGQWGRDILTLKTLRIVADQAQVQGQGQLNTTPAAGGAATAITAVKGQLALTLPGAQARLDGSMAPTQGTGTLDVALSDAGKTQRWIEGLPGLSQSATGARLQGEATLKGGWQGGWQSVQMRLADGKTPPASAGNLVVQANLSIPKLDIQLPPPATPVDEKTTVQLRGVRAELAGHLAQASLSAKGEATSGTQTIRLQTRMDGGMDEPAQWRASLASLQLQLQDSQQASPWTLQLDSPTNIMLRTTAPTAASTPKVGAAGTADLTVQASASAASLTGPVPGKVQLAWAPVRYERSGPADAPRHRLQTKGQLHGLPIAWARALVSSGNSTASNFGVGGSLVFGGDWDVDAGGDTLRARAQLSRTSGDVQVQTGEIPSPTIITSSGATTTPSAVANPTPLTGSPRPMVAVPLGPTTSAGVRQAQLTLDANDQNVRAQLIWDSENAGQAQVDATTQLTRSDGSWSWAPDAPVAGKVQANMPSIGAWSVFAPPGWRVQGTLDANAQLSGTRNSPRWTGALAANGLSVRSVVDGVDMQDGRLRATLNGQRIDITEFTLRGGTGNSTRISGFSGNRTTDAVDDGGTLTGRGFATWGAADASVGSGIRLEFNANAKALRVMVRSDRQVTLSGTMQTRLNDGQLTLRANLKADRAAIILPDESAPQLGKDVVVRSASQVRQTPSAAPASDQAVPRVQTPKPPDIAITFNLGDDFAVQGHGITTRLRGELDIRSTMGLARSPRVTGEIRTDNGKYRAYGQQLDIETGVIRFNGTLENPSIDVLALRPNISVRAGVQITGNAQSPRVRLYSDPVMPDAEKLSWVVLGHSTANGGAEAALLQQAALTLLGRRGAGPGSVANRLGLDEVGFRAPVDGESASGAVLTFGKRFSQNMYVTYESSLSSALGTLFIFYDLTRNLTLRAQTGVRSAVDLIYTVSFD